ncbi:MAG: hypothetical protein M3467_09320 [Actinomycetota bacterium]|jgi:hypothetical protein|nr:hypothetical protein [Acidothermales bacterium]MDQ3432401.1 hypothetical protein [Actinomycetota bacterium]
MPTIRPRYVITETERVAQALDAAAKRWPAASANRTELLRRLVDEGHRSVIELQERHLAARRDAVARTSGAFTGVYGPNYLAELREDWPA